MFFKTSHGMFPGSFYFHFDIVFVSTLFGNLETVDRLWKFSSFTQSMDEFSPQKKTENPSDTVPNSDRFPWFPFCFMKFASYLGKYKQKNRAEVHSRAWRNCVCSCQMVACSVKFRGRPMGSHGSSPWSRCVTPIQSNSGSERYLSRQFTYTYIYIIYRGLIESDVQSSVEQKTAKNSCQSLQDAIAVTQNFCNEWNAASVSSTECDGLIRFWRKKNGVVFHLWKLHLIHELFINDSVRIPYIYCGQYMLSFLSDFSFHSWNVGSLSSPQVWRCAKATHPLLARQLRERLEEHCSREAVLPGDDPTQSYLYLGVFLTSLTLIYEKSQGVFQQQIWKKGLQCMVGDYLYYITCYVYCHYLAAEAFGWV